MVVIAIVALLTVIALPNFANQSSKAKMTEAKTLASAALKQAAGAFSESGAAGVKQWGASQCPGNTRYFEFSCNGAAGTLPIVTAVGTAEGGDLKSLRLIASVDLDTQNSGFGQIKMCGTMPGLAPCSPGG